MSHISENDPIIFISYLTGTLSNEKMKYLPKLYIDNK